MAEASVDLIEVDVLQETPELTEFPCAFIEGIETENEYLFFSRRKVEDANVCIPMFFECEGEKVKLGDFPLTLDFLLVLRSIGDYKVTLFTDKNTAKPLDLNDAETLQKFIKL